MIYTKPDCAKCGNPAMGLISSMWLCGDCIIKLQSKLNKLKQELILNELS